MKRNKIIEQVRLFLISIFIACVGFQAFAAQSDPKPSLSCQELLSKISQQLKTSELEEAMIHRDPYRWLEAATPDLLEKQNQWLQLQQEYAQKYFNSINENSDSVYARWKKDLYKAYDYTFLLKKVELKDNFSLNLFEKGLGVGNEIVLLQDKWAVRVLFSSSDISKNGSAAVNTFWTDPQKKYLIVPVIQNGSLEHSDIHIIDITSGKKIGLIESVRVSDIVFIKQNSFIYFKNQGSQNLSYLYEIDKKISHPIVDGYKYRQKSGYVYYTENHATYLRTLDEDEFDKIDLDVQSIVARTNQALYALIAPSAEGGFPDLYYIGFENGPVRKKIGHFRKIPLEQGVFETISIDHKSGFVLLSFKMGIKRWAYLLDYNGECVTEIDLPKDGYLSGFSFSDTDRELIYLNFKNIFNDDVSARYNYFKKQFVNRTKLLQDLLKDSDGRRYRSQIMIVESNDGTKVPVKILSLSSTKISKHTPALVQGYGGFCLAGYLDSIRCPDEVKIFLNDGGIFIAPALRGGDEFGPQWHKQAQGPLKQNTFNDMIATLQAMKDNQISSPEKIAIMGWSNGGLMVGAMLTQRPDLFKFAVIGNGLLDMLRKEVLDAPFDHGWSNEYGSSHDPVAFKYLLKYSPVSNVFPANYPSVLIVTGKNDSRVNPVHSYKFAAALQKANEGSSPIVLLAVDQTGHDSTSIDIHDWGAYETLSAIWGMLYHELGMTRTTSSK